MRFFHRCFTAFPLGGSVATVVFFLFFNKLRNRNTTLFLVVFSSKISISWSLYSEVRGAPSILS